MDATSDELARLAVIEARVRHYGEPARDEVIRRSGATPEEHGACRDALLRTLADEATRQQATVAAAYATPFSEERRRLGTEAPAISALGELPLPAPPPTPPAPTEAGEGEPAPEEPAAAPERPAAVAPRLVPSYLREPAAATPVKSPVVAAPAPVVAPHITPVEIRLAHLDAAGPDSTQPPIRRSGPATPFAPAPEGEPHPRAAPAASRAKPAAAVEEEPTRASADGGGDETAFLPRTAFTGPATPFEKKGEPDPGEVRRQGEPAETMALDEDQLRAAAATPEPWIRLEEYAAFLGELSKDPSRAGILRAKYGIAGEDAQRALGAGFAAKFQREPSLRARFDALLAVERAKR